MKILFAPSFLLAALGAAFAAAPASAQVSISARVGRHVSVQVGFPDACRIEPVRRPRHDRDDDDHRHRHGRWETRWERVVVPGYWHEEHVPPSYGWIHDRCGRRYWGVVDPGGCRRVWVPERCEMRQTRVWVRC